MAWKFNDSNGQLLGPSSVRGWLFHDNAGVTQTTGGTLNYLPDPTAKGSIVVSSPRIGLSGGTASSEATIGSQSNNNALPFELIWHEPGFFRNYCATFDGPIANGGSFSGHFGTTTNNGLGVAETVPYGLMVNEGNSYGRDPFGWIYVQRGEPVGLVLRCYPVITAGNASQGTLHAVGAEFVSDARPVVTALCGRPADSVNPSGFRIYGVWALLSASSSDLERGVVIPKDGTLSNFLVTTSTGPTNPVTYTVRVNNADTALTITQAAGTTGFFYDQTHTVNVSAGDYVAIRWTSTVGVTPTNFQNFRFSYQPTSGDTSIIGGALFGVSQATTTASYNSPMSNNRSGTLGNNQLGFPIGGTVSHLYGMLSTASGVGINTTFTLNVNGSDTSLSGTIGAGVTGPVLLDSSHSITINQDDLVTLKVQTNTGSSGNLASWSARFDPA